MDTPWNLDTDKNNTMHLIKWINQVSKFQFIDIPLDTAVSGGGNPAVTPAATPCGQENDAFESDEIEIIYNAASPDEKALGIVLSKSKQKLELLLEFYLLE